MPKNSRLAPKAQMFVGLTLVTALTLSACGSDGAQGQLLPDYDPVPVAVDTPAAEVDTSELRLPLQLADNQVLEPGWQTPPHYADDVFLSAADDDDVLTFRAVDTSGTVLWEAQRPLSCTGFTLTSGQDQSYAVLTDIDDDVQGFGNTVASAYDLHTGEAVWGPVDAPGPHQGPGTVFGAPPEEAMGDSGPKVLLDPATGNLLLDETADDVTILGEFHGTVLLMHNDQVEAYRADELADTGLTAEPLWTIPTDTWDNNGLTARLPVTSSDPSDDPGAVLLGTNDTNRALVQLATGEVLADQLTAAGQDPSSQTWVTIGQQYAGYAADGQLLYQEANHGLQFRGVGAAVAYLENADGDLEARNVVTGDIGRSYDPQDTGALTVPTLITATGAGILDAGEQYYLVPIAQADTP